MEAIPEEALTEVERALEDLALAPRAGIRKRKQYIYIEIDAQRLCRLEYLVHNGQWALDLPRWEGTGYGERGEARFYRPVGSAHEQLLEAFKRQATRSEERRLIRILQWLLNPPWWFGVLTLILLPLILLLQWLLMRLLSRGEEPSSSDPA
jgi:hypothetical protein